MLLGGHAADVVVEGEHGVEADRLLAGGLARARATALFDGDEKRAAVLLVGRDLHVLHQVREFDHAPADPLDLRLHQNELDGVDDQEPTLSLLTRQLDSARDQIARVQVQGVQAEVLGL